jgi:[phosphatase 2A protein]-leucine-carboxy methyltransferase
MLSFYLTSILRETESENSSENGRRFAVEKGYWKDPFISLLTQRSQNKHAPEINRGYYARVTAMRTLLQKFIRV